MMETESTAARWLGRIFTVVVWTLLIAFWIGGVL